MYLKSSKIIVIKIGSSLLIDNKMRIRQKWLFEFAKDIKDLINQNKLSSPIVSRNFFDKFKKIYQNTW